MTKEEQAHRSIKLLNLKDSILMSSFQTTSVVLLNMFHELGIEIDVGFIDTGWHFEETLKYRDKLMGRFKIRIKNITPSDIEEPWDTWRRDKETCCKTHKIYAFSDFINMANYKSYISGAYGRDVQFCDTKFNKIKFCPLYDWAYADFMEYVDRKKLPKHPLHDKGYLSIGCEPCTIKVEGKDERSGRWPGLDKNRCGL